MSNLNKLLDDKWPLKLDTHPSTRHAFERNRRLFTEGYNVAIKEIGLFSETDGKNATSFFDLITKFVNQ